MKGNHRKIECKMKTLPGVYLSDWDQRKLSEDMRNLFDAYQLEYLIIIRNTKKL